MELFAHGRQYPPMEPHDLNCLDFVQKVEIKPFCILFVAGKNDLALWDRRKPNFFVYSANRNHLFKLSICSRYFKKQWFTSMQPAKVSFFQNSFGCVLYGCYNITFMNWNVLNIQKQEPVFRTYVLPRPVENENVTIIPRLHKGKLSFSQPLNSWLFCFISEESGSARVYKIKFIDESMDISFELLYRFQTHNEGPVLRTLYPIPLSSDLPILWLPKLELAYQIQIHSKPKSSSNLLPHEHVISHSELFKPYTGALTSTFFYDSKSTELFCLSYDYNKCTPDPGYGLFCIYKLFTNKEKLEWFLLRECYISDSIARNRFGVPPEFLGSINCPTIIADNVYFYFGPKEKTKTSTWLCRIRLYIPTLKLICARKCHKLLNTRRSENLEEIFQDNLPLSNHVLKYLNNV